MFLKSIASNFALSFSIFCISFFLAWMISAYSNFLYSTWYEVLSIDAAISKYAPNNKFKKGFENSDKRQHIELFSGIVNAIQDGGNGLKELHYTDNKNNKSETLLTKAEVLHLQDVANLVVKFKYLGFLGLVVACVVLIMMRFGNIEVASFKKHLVGGVGLVLLLTAIVLIAGPTEIFYLGHELIFPDNHQWFFYYEESLMSTMMKAPALFGPIACQLLVLTIILWVGFLAATKIVIAKR